jgi:hypothetical protein
MNNDGDEYICSYTTDCVMDSFFDDEVDFNDDRYKAGYPGYYDKFLEEQNPKNEEEKKKKRKKKRSKKKKKKKKKPK